MNMFKDFEKGKYNKWAGRSSQKISEIYINESDGNSINKNIISEM